MVLGKNPPGKKPPDPKPNPVPNLTLTLPLTPHGGIFPGGFFPDISGYNHLQYVIWKNETYNQQQIDQY